MKQSMTLLKTKLSLLCRPMWFYLIEDWGCFYITPVQLPARPIISSFFIAQETIDPISHLPPYPKPAGGCHFNVPCWLLQIVKPQLSVCSHLPIFHLPFTHFSSPIYPFPCVPFCLLRETRFQILVRGIMKYSL